MRGDGSTTRQMKDAPKGAHFVWVNSLIDYPKALAKKIGREDLVIVSPSFLSDNRWRGLRFSGLVIDHAAPLDHRQNEAAEMIQRLYVNR